MLTYIERPLQFLLPISSVLFKHLDKTRFFHEIDLKIFRLRYEHSTTKQSRMYLNNIISYIYKVDSIVVLLCESNDRE